MSNNPNSGSVCINHPDTLAVAHCCVCRRPVCKDCLIERDGYKCCSEECLKMARESTSRVAGIMDRRRSTDRKCACRRFVRLVILAAILVLLFLFHGSIMRGYNQHIRPLFNKGSQRIDEINRKNIQRDHERRHQREDMLEQLSQ